MNAGFKSIVLVAAFMLFFGRECDAFTPSTDSRSVGLVRSMRLSGLTVYMVSSGETQKERREALGSIKALHPDEQRTKLRRKYKRQREKPPTEKEVELLKKRRQEEFENLVALKPANVWSFESLFPKPVFDETSIQEDLFGVAERDKIISKRTEVQATEKAKKKGSGGSFSKGLTKIRTSTYGGSSIMRIWREPKLGSNFVPSQRKGVDVDDEVSEVVESNNPLKSWNEDAVSNLTVDRDMTQKVEGAVFGIRRTKSGDYEYDTSLVSDGAVKFRDGVRLGQALKINADLLNYNAKKEMAHGRLEEAQELYERALATDPRDGRAYLGLSRIAERRRDFKLARNILKSGITESVSVDANGEPDLSGNPFLLQALGCLEEKTGHLSQAEALYIAAVKSRPSHAASWVSLAQLRTRKLRQNAAAGRLCFQTAERELKKAGLPPSSYVYTAWASLEYKKAGDARRARELFQAALDVDPSCSVAYLQLGVMESDKENWEVAEKCFERALKFDKRNSRILQAFAIMESRRPDGSSRRTIDLFERALKANPRDAVVLQAYALFVAKLGDFDTARSLIRRGTEVNKRHAPLWQAWGVLEHHQGNHEKARDIFQQGIWSCSQLSGGQSGGYGCTRLWQAWGILEADAGDHAAARRCFARALDADNRNFATITAWTLMEEELGNERDARAIFERALKQFPTCSDEKMSLWRAYELMEQRLGNLKEAQSVYQRSMRETIAGEEEHVFQESGCQDPHRNATVTQGDLKSVLKRSDEVEVVRWDSLGGEVWMMDGYFESKVPAATMRKNRSTKQQ